MSGSATTFPTKVIAEIAAFVAVSTALSYVKVFSLPQGGSVTAGSMVPVIWLSLRRGAKIGLFACMLYGLVQLVIEAFIFHPAQVLLDYPIAFGALGLAGFFQKRPSFRRNGLAVDVDRLVSVLLCIVTFALFSYELAELRLSEALFFAWLFAFSFVFLLWLEDRRRANEKKDASKLVTPALFGAAVGIFGRFLAHFISGVVFFGSYAPEGLSPIIYSALYNGAYIVPELLVSAYLIYLLAKSGLIGIYK